LTFLIQTKFTYNLSGLAINDYLIFLFPIVFPSIFANFLHPANKKAEEWDFLFAKEIIERHGGTITEKKFFGRRFYLYYCSILKTGSRNLKVDYTFYSESILL